MMVVEFRITADSEVRWFNEIKTYDLSKAKTGEQPKFMLSIPFFLVFSLLEGVERRLIQYCCKCKIY